VKPWAAARSNPSWRGFSASRLSISFKLKGIAARIRSGSSSAANVVPAPASALPSWLIAYLFTEQELSSSAENRTSRFINS
jgi:hypothetical protein